ncbi:hypothetical protein SprV_0401427200 [Sparganum proliferum]
MLVFRTESSLMMKFLFGVLLIVSVVFCVSSSGLGNAASSSKASDVNATGNNTGTGNGTSGNSSDTTQSPTPTGGSPGGNGTSGNSSDTTQSTGDDTTTSGASVLSMTQCFIMSLPLVVFAKL